MKKKYSNEIIFNYISGNDLDRYSIDELEDDPKFMIDVMRVTHDKRMYNLCSSSVKLNSAFVAAIIEIFKDDIDFVTKIVNPYFENSDVEIIEKIKISIMLERLFNNEIQFDTEKYRLKNLSFYFFTMQNIAKFYKTEDKDIVENCTPFQLVEVLFPEQKILKDYIAQQMIDEIFFERLDCSFSGLLHISFKSREELEKYGERTFLLDYLRKIDPILSDYISCSPELLSDIVKSMKYIKKNWNIYNDYLNEEKIEKVLDAAEEYLNERKLSFLASIEDIVREAIEPLGLQELFAEYIKGLKDIDCENIDINDEPFELLDEYESADFSDDIYKECMKEEKSSLGYLGFVKYIREYAKKIFFPEKTHNIGDKTELDSDYGKDSSNEQYKKIIKYDFKNRHPIK